MSDTTRSGDNAGLQNFVKLHSAIADRGRSLSGFCPAATILQDVGVILGEAPVAGVVEAVEYIPIAAFVGADTNTRRFSLYNRKANGAGVVLVADLSMVAAVNNAAKVKRLITLSVTGANLIVAAGDVLEFTSIHVGTGIVDSGGYARVKILPS